MLTLLISLSAYAGTSQDWGKWKKGELLIENHSFEEDLAAWGLENGACCNRGGLYTITQSDVDFWINNFRYFEGDPEDDLNRDTPFSVNAKEKLATRWDEIKSDRF